MMPLPSWPSSNGGRPGGPVGTPIPKPVVSTLMMKLAIENAERIMTRPMAALKLFR